MEKEEIRSLEKVLKKAGVKEFKLESKKEGIYWIYIKQGFRIFKNESTIEIILNISGFEILIINYSSSYFRENGEFKKGIFLKPIMPPES